MERFFKGISSEMFSSLVIHNPDPIFLLDENGKVLDVNLAATAFFGYSASEFVNVNYQDIIAPNFVDEAASSFSKTLEGEITTYPVSVYDKNGRLLHILVKTIPIFDEEQRTTSIMLVIKDVPDGLVRKETLLRSGEKYRLIAENMTDLVTILDNNGVIIYASPSATPELGFPLEHYEGQNAFNFVHPDDLPEVREQCIEIFQSKNSINMEFRYEHKTKEWIWLEAKGTYCIDEETGEGFLLFVSRVIEEKKIMSEKLTQLAFHDELTGLPNRRFFNNIMHQLLLDANRSNEKFALLYIDIDKFKYVNDHLGHFVGDELLKQFSDRVLNALRERDVMARQSGDEFLVLLPNTDESEAIAIIKRIIDSLQEEWRIGEYCFTTTSSIGIAIFPKDGATVDELMANADIALYKAKENGRNRYMTYSN